MKQCLKFTLGFAFFAINLLMLLSPTSGYFEASLTTTSMIFKNETSLMNANGLRIKKVNRTYVLTGVIEVFEDVGNDYQILSYFYKKAGNEFKRMPYKIGPNNFCQYVDDEKVFFEGLRQESDFPAKGTCPWPKKKYTIKDYVVKLNNVPPVVGSGDYMAESQLLKNGKLLNGIQVSGKLEHV